MDNIQKISLLKEISYYTRLLKQHENLEKAKEQHSSTSHHIHQKPSSKLLTFSNDKMTRNQSHVSFDQKYSFKKSNDHRIINHNKRTVVYNNQNSKYAVCKNKSSKCVSLLNKDTDKNNVLNNNDITSCKKLSTASENKFNKVPNMPEKINAKNFIEELEYLTELLKKKTSGNQHLESSSTGKLMKVVQDKHPCHKTCNSNAVNTFKPLHYKTAFVKAKNLSTKPQAINTANIGNCYAKVNSNSFSFQQKMFNSNKFNHEKEEVLLNSKTAPKTLRSIDKSKNKSQKDSAVSASRKVIFSDLENAPHIFCSGNISTFASSPASSGKVKVNVKLTESNQHVSSVNKISKKSPNKVESLGLCKPSDLLKLKPSGAKYTKNNKELSVLNKTPLKYSIHRKTPLSKKVKRKVNTKYKVINKTLTPSSDKKKRNSSYKLVRINKSNVDIHSEAFLNDSAIDKLEKNLLAISTALTSTPLSGKSEVNDNEMHQYSLSKVAFKLNSKKNHMKKSKARISKYKIINANASQKCVVKKKQNFINTKPSPKKIKYSKFRLVNEPVQPKQMQIPLKPAKSVLVKRLYKSKNTIINKNTSPINLSAQMIKSKYMTLNKRKLPNWQKHSVHQRIPMHSNFKDYFLATKLYSKQKKFHKTSVSGFQVQVPRKFSSYSCQTFNTRKGTKALQYKHIIERKNKRKVDNRYGRSPVVVIRGMRYSLNSSGKTLKRLPVKGQTTKYFLRNSSKVLRSPEVTIKALTPTSNLANRVLHRSINRILTASSKKSLSKVNSYCMFYNRFGRCNKGVKCTYIHDPSKIAVCTRFLRGTCKIDGCPFSHIVDPGKMAICSFFLVGECHKDNCPYRHEKLKSDAVLCKDFVQGYCHNGKECKKAHILICPKYMQGECDKGSSCAFPHPPQKAKKEIKKDVDDEEKKQDDVLLEKVFRYFQQGGDCSLSAQIESDETKIINVFVPRQRRLEEQPSFIPLCDSPTVMHNSKQT